MQNLHRNITVMLQVLRQVDGGHPTATEFPLDGVAVGQCASEAVQNFGHTATPLGPALSYGFRLKRASLVSSKAPGVGPGVDHIKVGNRTTS